MLQCCNRLKSWMLRLSHSEILFLFLFLEKAWVHHLAQKEAFVEQPAVFNKKIWRNHKIYVALDKSFARKHTHTHTQTIAQVLVYSQCVALYCELWNRIVFIMILCNSLLILLEKLWLRTFASIYVELKHLDFHHRNQ